MNNKFTSKFAKSSKKRISATILTAGIMGITIVPENAYAHGFVEKPTSRATLCKSEYGALNKQCGAVEYDAHSLEALKGFPQNGPIDGKIASAGGLFGGILDQQTVDRWFKNTITGGPNTFTWKYTTAHATSKWHYYITKKGWNPNKSLTRADLEPIGAVEHNGSAASNNLSHTINVPTDRNGYHVILAVWDVADTPNAFYNVIDVNLINNKNPDTEAPTQPQGLHVSKVTSNSAELKWNPSTDNVGVKEYQVLRDGKVIRTVPGTTFIDENLKTNTKYTYTIKAVDAAGNESIKSNILTVTTKEQGASYELWNPNKAYTKGDKVEHQGKIYEAVQSYQGNGDPTWIFALSLWKPLATK